MKEKLSVSEGFVWQLQKEYDFDYADNVWRLEILEEFMMYTEWTAKKSTTAKSRTTTTTELDVIGTYSA